MRHLEQNLSVVMTDLLAILLWFNNDVICHYYNSTMQHKGRSSVPVITSLYQRKPPVKNFGLQFQEDIADQFYSSVPRYFKMLHRVIVGLEPTTSHRVRAGALPAELYLP